MSTISPSHFPESGQRKLTARETLQRAKVCLLAFVVGLMLGACSGDEKVGLSYVAYNHTDKGIYPIFINGEGGILDADAHGEGGGVCCVVLPKRWRPGLMATIKWRNDSTYTYDERGLIVTNDGVPVLIESPWKEKAVEVPKYDEEMGDFYIHFFPNDEVKVLVHQYGAGYEGHPYPHPDGTPAKMSK